ncbi:PQQ-dependent sugar dehydrogenase [Haloarchaeobius sp. HRN-SO-5]|uniref:PQQ-dependent sugar dehydrogenase n=1 Tax=Haloarchaeobius sp. HRN-SO-5 TaxID=3446118 RepID=UPI003EBC06D6
MERIANRRRFLAAVAASTTALAGCSDAGGGLVTTGGGPPTDGSQPTDDEPGTGDGTGTDDEPPGVPAAVGLEAVTVGMQAPLDVAVHPDADRRYVADQAGVVYVHDPDGRRDRPLLDLRNSVEFGGEKGLLGIALHPEFAENGRLFVRYSAPRRSGTPSSYSHTFVLAEFSVGDDGLRADRDSERTVLEVPEPQSNHNAGDLAFGPDGYLYVAVGDGGAGGDRGPGHVDDWYDRTAGGNGQDVTENLLGSILRLDVDRGDPYAVPEDNPLVGRAGRDEHYAWGLRNPWRMSFDGSDLFVGDVGQNRYEEVSLVRKGGNYGWNVKEGTHCYRTDDCPDRTPSDVRGGEPLVDPIVEYPHSGATVSGTSVIGGYVYRGSAIPGLSGRYVFGDLRPDGRLFVASRPDGDGRWPTDTLDVAGDGLQRLLSFGRDRDGELYALGIGADGGGLYRVVPAE